jgi:hypothetical protein
VSDAVVGSDQALVVLVETGKFRRAAENAREERRRDVQQANDENVADRDARRREAKQRAVDELLEMLQLRQRRLLRVLPRRSASGIVLDVHRFAKRGDAVLVLLFWA